MVFEVSSLCLRLLLWEKVETKPMRNVSYVSFPRDILTAREGSQSGALATRFVAPETTAGQLTVTDELLSRHGV